MIENEIKINLENQNKRRNQKKNQTNPIQKKIQTKNQMKKFFFNLKFLQTKLTEDEENEILSTTDKLVVIARELQSYQITR